MLNKNKEIHLETTIRRQNVGKMHKKIQLIHEVQSHKTSRIKC